MLEFGLTYFDIGAIIVVLIFLLIGLSRGFIKELSKLLSWVISLIGAKILTFPVETALYKFMKISEGLNSRITAAVSQVDFSSLETARASLTKSLSSVPGVGGLLDNFVSTDWKITEVIQSGAADLQTKLVNVIMDNLEPLAHQILQIAVFVGLFIVLAILVGFLFSLLNSVFNSIKLFGTANSLLGGVLGIVKGIVLIAVLYSLVFVVLSMSGSEYLPIFMDSRFFDILVGFR